MQNFSYENEFCLHMNIKTNFHDKNYAQSLSLNEAQSYLEMANCVSKVIKYVYALVLL